MFHWFRRLASSYRSNHRILQHLVRNNMSNLHPIHISCSEYWLFLARSKSNWLLNCNNRNCNNNHSRYWISNRYCYCWQGTWRSLSLNNNSNCFNFGLMLGSWISSMCIIMDLSQIRIGSCMVKNRKMKSKGLISRIHFLYRIEWWPRCFEVNKLPRLQERS